SPGGQSVRRRRVRSRYFHRDARFHAVHRAAGGPARVRSSQDCGVAKLNPYLSVVIPCFNEARKIEADIRAGLDYFRAQPYPSELILVDDGSSDATAAIVEQAAAAGGGVRA